MRLNMGRAKLVGVTRAPFISEDGGSAAQGACDTTGGRRVGAVVVDVGPDQDKAIQRAERKARTYGTALLVLASLLCLSVCGSLASSALSILVFKESRNRGAIQPVVPSDSRAAALVGTSLTAYGAEIPAAGWAPTGMKRCAVAPSGAEACWELADPQAMTNIPVDFLNGDTDLTGTLKVGAAVRTIGASAFANTKLTGLDLSEATALVEIGSGAFFRTNLAGSLVIPVKVTTIGARAFEDTKLTGLRLAWPGRLSGQRSPRRPRLRPNANSPQSELPLRPAIGLPFSERQWNPTQRNKTPTPLQALLQTGTASYAA